MSTITAVFSQIDATLVVLPCYCISITGNNTVCFHLQSVTITYRSYRTD